MTVEKLTFENFKTEIANMLISLLDCSGYVAIGIVTENAKTIQACYFDSLTPLEAAETIIDLNDY